MVSKYDWRTNHKEGRALRSAIVRLLKRAENCQDDLIYANLMRTFGYLVMVKGNLTKLEREKELEERISKLEEIAGMAQKSAPISQ